MPARLRRTVGLFFGPLRGRDLALHAAAVTFYAGIAVVPVGLLAVWLAGLIAGGERIRRLTGRTVAALPDEIGVPRALAALIEAGLHLTPLLALASLLPATLYGEGLRRAFVSLGHVERGGSETGHVETSGGETSGGETSGGETSGGETSGGETSGGETSGGETSGGETSGGSKLRRGGESWVGWRGRLLWLPLLAAAPVLLLAMLPALPITSGLWLRGGWWAVLAVVLSFLAAWLVLTPVVIWVFQYVAPGRPDWLPAVLIGSFTAANLSGFLHGFVLFASLPLDLGAPFGGLTVVGGMVAAGLWLYLFHVIVLAGYAATIGVKVAVISA